MNIKILTDRIKILKEKNGFQVISLNEKHYQLLDKDENVLIEGSRKNFIIANFNEVTQ